jgi:hypothetical protein
MAHSPDKPMEHAEHAQHAAHNPLDRKVAMSMAIIAAFLAAAAMVSHRGHTETLRLTTEANIQHTKATEYHTQASDMWNYYQSKNTLNREYLVLGKLVDMAQVKPELEEKREDAQKYLLRQIQKYEGTKDKEGELEKLKHDAESLVEKAKKNEEKAEAFEKTSHAVHHSVNWIDYGHLGLELALILASITVLTKQRWFWYGGLGSAAVGIGLAIIGVTGLMRLGHL